MNNYLSSNDKRKQTALSLRAMKSAGEKITMLTAYDYTMARLLDSTMVDVILVGDSAANVMAGYSTTLPITLDQMIYHASSVVRAVQHAMVVVDLPFGSYQEDASSAVRAAIRVMKESGADAIKMEGGTEILPAVKRIIAAGIPVIGHLGLTPQSIHKFGGYGVRAKEDTEAERLRDDAKALDEIGCCAIVLEKIPASLASEVSAMVSCPIIGIGAGAGVDGQVLVGQDMLGLTEGFKPKFLRQYADLATVVRKAVSAYCNDVKSGSFPSIEESY